jgi:hypothetical protein
MASNARVVDKKWSPTAPRIPHQVKDTKTIQHRLPTLWVGKIRCWELNSKSTWIIGSKISAERSKILISASARNEHEQEHG